MFQIQRDRMLFSFSYRARNSCWAVKLKRELKVKHSNDCVIFALHENGRFVGYSNRKTGMVCFVTNMNDRKLSCWTVIDFFWLFRYECNALEVLHT